MRRGFFKLCCWSVEVCPGAASSERKAMFFNKVEVGDAIPPKFPNAEMYLGENEKRTTQQCNTFFDVHYSMIKEIQKKACHKSLTSV